MNISPELQERIGYICGKFDNDINQIDVVNWLFNFREEDWNKAVTVLEHLDYYPYGRILSCYQEKILKILNDYSGKAIWITPLGDIGKSGQFVTYYINKVIKEYFREENVNLLRKTEKLKPNDVLVYADDFSGSGQTFIDNQRPNLPQDVVKCYLTLAYMENAKERVEKLGIQIYGDLHNSCFSQRGSVFGYPPRMIPIRNFCFAYGAKLFPLKDRKGEELKSYIGPLGYANSQSLVAFEYGIPNNTLPIIWANKNWTPLIPRFINTRIEKSVKYRSSQNYWLSIIYRERLAPKAFLNFKKYSTDAAQLFLLVRLIRRHKKPTFICQYLCISDNERIALIEKGKSLSLFNEDGDLTKEADSFYSDLELRMKVLKEELSSRMIYTPMDLYVPKSFQGKT